MSILFALFLGDLGFFPLFISCISVLLWGCFELFVSFNRAAFASEDRSHLSPDATSLVSEHSLCLFPCRFRFSPIFVSFVSILFWHCFELFVSYNNLWPQLPRARSGGVFFRCNFSSSTRHKKLGCEHSICLPCPFWLLSLFHFFH